MMLLVNPTDEFHFVYLDYHPDSEFRDPDCFFTSAEWDANLGSPEALAEALKNDPEWVDQFVKGKIVRSAGAIHRVLPSIILEPNEDLLEKILASGNLFRVLDHGDSSPTCCLWFAAIWGIYICYREYYVPNKLISYHRQAIFDLSGKEEYSGNYADPQIFKKTAQKEGGFWTVADEYSTTDCPAPPLSWSPADNNEFATRNKLNELLQTSDSFAHPTTKLKPAAGIYFIKATDKYPNGCSQAYRQLGSQRRKVLGSMNGKTIWSDDREESVVDHAYDCIRYFVAMRGSQPRKAQRVPERNSFAYYKGVMDIMKNRGVVAGSVN